MMVRGCCQRLAAARGGGGLLRPPSSSSLSSSSSSAGAPSSARAAPLSRPLCGPSRARSIGGISSASAGASTATSPLPLPPRRRAAAVAPLGAAPRRAPSPPHRRLSSSSPARAAASPPPAQPAPERDTFTITTPLFYVNAAPHMGSAYPTIAADVVARYQRLAGRRVRFITGTDEHGEKIALAAAAGGMEPQAHCDRVAAQYRALWEALDISYDAFVRTTDAAHEAVVRELLERAWDCHREESAVAAADGGEGAAAAAQTTTTAAAAAAAPSASSPSSSSPSVVYRATYSGHYCVGCEEYKDEAEMVALPETHPDAGATCCAVHRAPCQLRSEDNYFFALTKFQREIEALLSRGGPGGSSTGGGANADDEDESAASAGDAAAAFVVPSARRNEVLGWVREGLRDFSISRAKVKWGVPLPRDPSQTAYVWFDALAGYLTGTLAAAEADDARRALAGGGSGGNAGATAAADASFPSSSPSKSPLLDRVASSGWPADVHVVGKDILRFHAVYWPGMLSAAGLAPPRQILGHGFLTKDGLKMGKSLGNTLDPAALTAAYGADAVRYWLIKEVALGSDGNFREAAFRDSVNAGLANTVGNLLNRTLGMLHKYYPGGALPADSADPSLAPELRALVQRSVDDAADAYGRLAPHSAVEAVLAAAAGGNRFLEEAAPWTALKKGTDEEKVAAGRALVAALEAARVLAAALYPVTPALAGRVWSQLNAPGPALPPASAAAWGPSGDGGLRGGAGAPATWEGATRWGQLSQGHVTAAPEPVFLRIEEAAPYVAEVAPGAEVAAGGKGGGGKKGGGGGGNKQQQQQQQQQRGKKKAKEGEQQPAAAGAA